MAGLSNTNIGVGTVAGNFSTGDEGDGQFHAFRKQQVGWGDRIGDVKSKSTKDSVSKAYKKQMAFKDAAEYFKLAGSPDQYDINHMDYALAGRVGPKTDKSGEDKTRQDVGKLDDLNEVEVSSLLDAFSKFNNGKYTVCSTAAATSDKFAKPIVNKDYDGQINI
jgi:hypothetical protein